MPKIQVCCVTLKSKLGIDLSCHTVLQAREVVWINDIPMFAIKKISKTFVLKGY